MQFKKKPVVIEAFKWTGDIKPFPSDFQFAVCAQAHDGVMGEPHIHTLEGMMNISMGDWIIKGVKGEFYPCKSDIFHLTYDEVEKAPTP